MLGPAILLAAAVLAVIAALSYGGGAAPTPLLDAGAVVRWGLPIAKLAVNLSAATLVGTLALTLFALKPDSRAFDQALALASAGAALLTVTSAVTAFLTFLNVYVQPLSIEPEFGTLLGQFLTSPDAGLPWLITVIGAALLTVCTFLVRGWTPLLLVTALAIAALVPMAGVGHSGDRADHTLAVTSLVLHTIGAAVWLGGLLALVILRPALADSTNAVLLRYSTLALAAFVVVAGSGLVRSAVGVGAWQNLGSPYGVLVIVKAVLLMALGIAGAWYRTRLLRAGAGVKTKRFWSMVVAELALMGLASGVAAGLARTPPPTGAEAVIPTSPAQWLTGSPLPPELTPLRMITEWKIDVLWAAAVAFGIVFYLAGVRRLVRRGDHWPPHRTVLWLLGMLLLLWVTCGAVNVYQEVLFSIHMLGHMLLTMAIPLLLVAGAPVTLIMRAVRKRDDGTRGVREWVLWAVHSPFGRIVTHPIVAAAIFVGSLWVFYYTDLLRWSVYDHLGHEWMTVHFLLSGYLFVLSLIGADPVPFRFPYPGRLITLIAVAAMHAFFGVALMMQTGLMVSEWYGAMARPWGPTPMEDQYIGGGIAWSIGEIPTLIVAITVAIQWSRNDDRTQRQRDRHADRTGDAELAEYNRNLAALAERDARAELRER